MSDAATNEGKAVDGIQERLTTYACGLNYSDLSPEAIGAAKARVVDTLGAAIAGFFGEPCRIVRNLASQMPYSGSATIIGSRFQTTPDMAAFVNATTARYPELTDFYHWPGSFHGRPSDTITPVLAIAEQVKADGRAFLTAIVLAYEVYLRISDIFQNKGFDITNFGCIASAVGAGKLLNLSAQQLAHCISMAVVPNVILRQVRSGDASLYKAVAAGQAGRAGVFAAMLAQAGMEGPHLPFEGKAGWCEHVARAHPALDTWGGNGTPFKIMDSQIRTHPCSGDAIACVLAAEKIAPVANIKEVREVIVELYKSGNERGDPWNPHSREAADHSVPYNVAVTLLDGTVTLRSYSDTYLWNPELRTLIKKIKVVENTEFAQAFKRLPVEHRTRVTVVTGHGDRLVGEAGGGEEDVGAPKSNMQIEKKFRDLTQDYLGVSRVNSILDRLWHLEDMKNVAVIPATFILD